SKIENPPSLSGRFAAGLTVCGFADVGNAQQARREDEILLVQMLEFAALFDVREDNLGLGDQAVANVSGHFDAAPFGTVIHRLGVLTTLEFREAINPEPTHDERYLIGDRETPAPDG